MSWRRTRLPFGVAVAVLLVLGTIGLSNTAGAAQKTTARLWWVYPEFEDTESGCQADPSFGTTDGEFSASIRAASATKDMDEVQLNLDDGRRVQVIANGRKADVCGYKLRFRVTNAKNYRLRIGSFGIDIPKARLFDDLPAVIEGDFLADRGTTVRPRGPAKPPSLSFEVGGSRYEARMTGVEFGADFPGDLPVRPGREAYRVSIKVTNLQTDRIAGRPFEFQLYARTTVVAAADCELVRTHDVTGPDGETYCELKDTEISDGLASGEVFSAGQTVTWVLGNRPGNSIPEGSLRPADLLVLAHIGNVIPDQRFGFLPQLEG